MSEPSAAGDRSALRVGNTERAFVTDLLRTAGTEGRLDPAEVAQRSGDAGQARTFGDLDALVADLPITPPSISLLGQPAAGSDLDVPPVRPNQPGYDPTDPLRISGGMSTERRRGVWDLPPYLRLSGELGAVVLDCLLARCEHDVVRIEVSGGVGTVKLIVPDGWSVNTDRVQKSFGSVRNKTNPEPAPGQPLLIMEGSAVAGSIIARYASRWDRRRLRKQGYEQPGLPASQWTTANPELPNANDLR